MERSGTITGDLWGGLAAMLVALPSAIAFGVTIFAPLGGGYAAQGAVAGMLGATALGVVAAAFGGTKRLITVPCAPATAVLGALATGLTQEGAAPQTALLTMVLVGLACGLLQVLFGALGLGRLIKYMPYPVVSGYLSGVGLIIIVGQAPKLLGVAPGVAGLAALDMPSLWSGPAVIVGVVTVAAMLAAPRLTKAVPAAILALAAGVLAYFALASADRRLLAVAGNALLVGPLRSGDTGFLEVIGARWSGLGHLQASDLYRVLTMALTLAVLLSIDTLKTSVVLDSLTHTRHDSNRELIGQGLGNLASALIGGVPGSGAMGPTLVNVSSGGSSRLSGIVEGLLALAAFLALAKLLAWFPLAALAGILLVIGVRMIDWNSLRLLRSRSTVLDFVVVVTVVVIAQAVSLIAASAAGIGLAILLFVREQIGGSVVRRKSYGNRTFSKQVRLPDEMAVLEHFGERCAILELQGSLFFGTADQLYRALEPELKARDYVVLDMRRVQSVDLSAAHLLEQLEDMLAERGAYLLFSDLPRNVPSGQDMRAYFAQLGLARAEHHARVFGALDAALEWVEDRILAQEGLARAAEAPLQLEEIDLFRGRKPETLAALKACMGRRACKAGEAIFRLGDTGDELFLVRRGAVRILLPLAAQQEHHLATFGRGNFFGEMAFLDRAPRSANAVAYNDVELFVLSRQRFDALAEQHRHIALNLLEALARALAIRLRYANSELSQLQAS